MSQDIPNVHPDAVTGLDHDPVQGAVSKHAEAETVDHPHNTADDQSSDPGTADAAAEQSEQTGGEASGQVSTAPQTDAQTGGEGNVPPQGSQAPSGDPAQPGDPQTAGETPPQH